MRVLQAMAGAEYGGAEAFFVRLAGALQRTGLEQRIVIRQNPARAEALRAEGIEPVQLKFGGAMDWQTPRALKKEIKTFKPDVVLTWMNRATGMCPKGEFAHAARLGGYYDLKYYRNCDHLIGNTEDIVSYLVKEGWPDGKAHYLPNFVSAEPAEPLSRRALYTPDSVPLILTMGRLHENKGFDVMLEALSRVPNAYLWIAGEGPLRGELEKMAEKMAVKPRVRFLGWRDDIAALLATCDLYVCPSRHEPLGNVVLEAWAHGRPVVAADSYGPGTLIEHLESGVLVPTEDAVMLAKAVRMVIDDDDLRTRIAQRGFEVYNEHFTESSVVRQYMEFFERIAG
jgi:glycosyltransferase involved in cell wall biosynthesis